MSAGGYSYVHCVNVVLRIVHLHQLTYLRLLLQGSLQILIIYHFIHPSENIE